MDEEPGPADGASPLGEPPEAAKAFAANSITSREALTRLGLRDYAELLVLLGDFGLAPPRPNDREVEEQAGTFERVWNAVRP